MLEHLRTILSYISCLPKFKKKQNTKVWVSVIPVFLTTFVTINISKFIKFMSNKLIKHKYSVVILDAEDIMCNSLGVLLKLRE